MYTPYVDSGNNSIQKNILRRLPYYVQPDQNERRVLHFLFILPCAHGRTHLKTGSNVQDKLISKYLELYVKSHDKLCTNKLKK